MLTPVSRGSISVSQDKGKLNFDLFYPDDWTFAKISVTNSKNTEIQTTAATPSHPAEINVYENGQYWIEGKIKVGEETFDAFNIVNVNSVPPNTSKPFDFFNIPQKQIGLIVAIIAIVGIIGIRFSRKKSMGLAQHF